MNQNREKNFDIIMWDVDGTLLDFLASERFALTDCLEHYGLPYNEETIKLYSAINISCWKKLERGEVTKAWVLIHRFEELFLKMGWNNPDIKEFQARYQRQLGSVFFFQDEADKLLPKLSKDFSQYVVTNGVEWTQRNKLKLAGIEKSMKDIFISECMGAEKPNPKFFDACFEKMNQSEVFDKERILVVGDSLTSDMRGANNAGLKCCYYNRGNSDASVTPQTPATFGEVRVDYQIGNLWEVERILWQNQQIKN